jgi:hypothetical protein
VSAVSNGTNAEGTLSLTEQVQLVDAISSFQRLLLLDRLWTHAVDQGRVEGAEQIADLQGLTDEIDSLLSSAPGHAQNVLQAAEQRPELLRTRFDTFLAEHLPEANLELANAFVERHGDGIVDLAVRQSSVLIEQATAEQEQLQVKIQQIQQGGEKSGDISGAFACAVFSNIVAGGVLLCVESGGGGCAVAVGALIAADAFGC